MSVFAVPRSMARSREKRVCNQSNIEVVVSFREESCGRSAALFVEHVSVAEPDGSTPGAVPGMGL